MLTLAPLLARPPSLLIADEPSLGLAPLIVEQVTSVFKELRDQGVTLLLAEEKPGYLLPVADDVAFLELGAVTWHGACASVDEAALSRLHLGHAGVTSK
jgi:ABC-type branched-subunit amino acid transport system ATPase component